MENKVSIVPLPSGKKTHKKNPTNSSSKSQKNAPKSAVALPLHSPWFPLLWLFAKLFYTPLSWKSYVLWLKVVQYWSYHQLHIPGLYFLLWSVFLINHYSDLHRPYIHCMFLNSPERSQVTKTSGTSCSKHLNLLLRHLSHQNCITIWTKSKHMQTLFCILNWIPHCRNRAI